MSVGNIVRFGTEGWQLVNQQIRWREVEYAKIGALRVGMSIQKLEESMGAPLVQQRSGNYTQRLYLRHDYWVQAIFDAEGATQVLTVTSCDERFRPTVQLRALQARITLNQTTLGSLTKSLNRQPGAPSPIDLFRPFVLLGGSRSSYYYEAVGGSHASLFTVDYLGFDGACYWLDKVQLDLVYSATDQQVAESGYAATPVGSGAPLSQLRMDARIQTVAEVMADNAICLWPVHQPTNDIEIGPTLSPPMASDCLDQQAGFGLGPDSDAVGQFSRPPTEPTTSLKDRLLGKWQRGLNKARRFLGSQ